MDIFTIKFMIIFIIIVCSIFSLIEIGKLMKKCPEEQIIYKYIPRTFEEESNNPINIEDLFKSMFNESSPWMK